MRFPRFWARSSTGRCQAWGWSDASQADAEAQARDRARHADEHRRTDGSAISTYGYGERPFREPVLREIRGRDGGLEAVLTRNAYGAQILNAARALFVDVDLPMKLERGSGGWFRRLIRRAEYEVDKAAELAALERAERWAAAKPGWNWRVYRTRAGLRLLATQELFDAVEMAAGPLFRELGADPRYSCLCKAQRCFRARLTPKPWRLGLAPPPERWPFRNAAAESRFNDWQRRYEAAREAWATCRLVAVFGTGEPHRDLEEVIALHDRLSRADVELPLA